MLIFLKQHGTLIVVILALFAGLAVLQQWDGALVPPIEQMKSNCPAPDQHVDYDCLVAAYTQKLARLTLWLVAATAFLGLATFIAALAAKAASDHIPTVERAFIHGGVHPKGRKRETQGGEAVIAVNFSMANYGKTPGFIKSIKFGSCNRADIPDVPIYTKEVEISDLYFPQMKMDEVRFPDYAEITVPADGEHVVFQRVFYDDVFKKEHFSGSIHRMYLDEKGEVRDEVVGKPAYWDWN